MDVDMQYIYVYMYIYICCHLGRPTEGLTYVGHSVRVVNDMSFLVAYTLLEPF